MTIHFSCPLCGKKLSASDSLIGRERTCPKCRAKIKVPKTSTSRATDAEKEDGRSSHGVMPSHGEEHEEDLVDMTAMVDIVFFLLIFFMTTSLASVQSVIGLPTPQTSTPSANAQVVPDLANDPSFIAVAIEADDSVWVEDEQVFGPQSLRVKLRDLRKRDFQPTGMIVTGNPEASHGTLVMVLDAGVDAGMEDLRFSVSESLDDMGG